MTQERTRQKLINSEGGTIERLGYFHWPFCDHVRFEREIVIIIRRTVFPFAIFFTIAFFLILGGLVMVIVPGSSDGEYVFIFFFYPHLKSVFCSGFWNNITPFHAFILCVTNLMTVSSLN